MAILKDTDWRYYYTADATAKDALYGDRATIIEIDCEGSICGGTASDSSNASTNHNAHIHVVINGEYHHTYGPPVGYVQGGKVWMLGTYSHHALSATNNYSFSFDVAESAWLDCCTSSDSTKDIGGGTVYIRDCTLSAGTSDATLVAY